MNSNEIIPFAFNGKSVRVVTDEYGDPWFVGADVCAVLDIENSRQAISRLSASMKGVTTVDTPGGPQQMVTVSEGGLYKLTFTSRKPEAERFIDWVAGEVLPSLRKHGRFEMAGARKMQSAGFIALAKSPQLPKLFAQASRSDATGDYARGLLEDMGFPRKAKEEHNAATCPCCSQQRMYRDW